MQRRPEKYIYSPLDLFMSALRYISNIAEPMLLWMKLQFRMICLKGGKLKLGKGLRNEVNSIHHDQGVRLAQRASRRDTATRAHHIGASGGTLKQQSVASTLDIRATGKSVKPKIFHTLAKARQRHAVHGQRLVLVVAVIAHGEAHKHKLAHVAHNLEPQTELLLPYRVEAVVLDRGVARYVERGWTCGWRRIEAPVGKVHRDLDVRVEGGLVDNLVAVCILRERELLGRDHLDEPTRIRLGETRGTG